MIDRYAREAMKAIWQDQFKFETWLEVELAVCKAWAEHGEIPVEDIPLLERATFDMAHWEVAFATTRHDVTAFLSSISRDLGPESRHIHKGLTSNDVWDTATALQLRAAGKILLEGIDKLEEAIARRAIEHKDTLMMGRTHGVHAEPTTFGLKLALWVEETRRMRQRLEQATRGISVGKFSGAVGTHATLPPEVEETACKFLGLEVEKISSQIVPRDRHAEFVSVLALCAASLEKFATEIRGLQRTEVREVEEPFHAGQTGSSAMPHKRKSGVVRAHLRPGATDSRTFRDGAGERGAVARAGYFTFVGGAHHPAGRDDGARLHPRYRHVCHWGDGGVPGDDARQRGEDEGVGVLAARDARAHRQGTVA